VEAFKQGFVIDDDMYANFTEFAIEEEVERKDDDEYYYPDESIKIQLKALLARNLWGVNAYFVMINELDDELHEAVDILKDGKMFSELNLN
jgi:carboxyl-terminal processing protease